MLKKPETHTSPMDAYRARQIREAKKNVAITFALTFAGAVILTAAASYMEKKWGNSPLEDI